jgi:hypothetical protein
MLKGRSRILCVVISVIVLCGCFAAPANGVVMPGLTACPAANYQHKPKDAPVSYGNVQFTESVQPAYDYSDIDSYNLYFGQLNSHSSQSDGTGSLDSIYKNARDVAKLDFFAITDISDMFDRAAGATLSDRDSSSEWITGKAYAEYYTNANFVGIYGFEMAWQNGNGHISTFNTEGFETAQEPSFSGPQGLRNYYEALKRYPASLSQFNHPGSKHGNFADFGYYDQDIDALISLIEVGNGEGAVRSQAYYPSYDQYTRALDKGWHLAPTNNQDNRKEPYGNANTARTVILARSLTQDELFSAIRNRRVYATEDQNLKIKYTLNGQVMGSILNAKPSAVNIKVELEESAGEKIGMVSVIANNGKVLKSETVATSKHTLSLTLPPDYSYFYIRVDQFDKDIAVTAPIWINSGSKSGIAKTYAGYSAPDKGQKTNITTEVFNNESTDMTLSSIVFTADGKPFKTLESPGVVKAGSTKAYTVEYIPPANGNVKIEVLLKASIRGTERVYADAISIGAKNLGKKEKPVADAVKNVTKLIQNIVWRGWQLSENSVKEARKAYDALTAEQKKQVYNYYSLVAAEQWLEWFKKWGGYWWYVPGRH